MPNEKNVEYKVLEVKVNSIEKDVNELKQENKETKELLNNNIISLSENIARQTTLMENLTYRIDKNDERDNYQDEQIYKVNRNMNSIKSNLESSNKMVSFVDTHAIKIVWVLILIIAMLVGVNIDADAITKIIL